MEHPVGMVGIALLHNILFFLVDRLLEFIKHSRGRLRDICGRNRTFSSAFTTALSKALSKVRSCSANLPLHVHLCI